MCKLHGVRLIKGIKIFESLPKNQNLLSLLTKQLGISLALNWSSIFQTDFTVCRGKM